MKNKIYFTLILLYFLPHPIMQSFINKAGQEIQRTQCQVYTRVMGYLRPVNNYNTGKKSEFYSRKYIDESKTMNSEFTKKFSNLQTNSMYNVTDEYQSVNFVGCGCVAAA